MTFTGPFKTTGAILLLTLGVQALAPLAPRAHADDGAGVASHPTYTFSMDIPDRGALDMYHNAFTLRDPISDALYVLRNIAVEDLLNTRKSLKVLLGGSTRLAQIARQHPKVDPARLTFDLPSGVIDLYLLGMLPSQVGYRGDGEKPPSEGRSKAKSSPSARGPLSPARAHGLDRELRPELATTLHWLIEKDPAFDPELRKRLLVGLAYTSALLTKFDQQLKFATHDFFDTPPMNAEFYRQEIMPEAGLAPQMIPDLSGISERRHTQWLEKHGMKDALAAWAGQRAYLLDRYHLLGVEIGDQPLYKLIYAKMEAAGFPAAAMVQPARESHLPQGAEPIQMPDDFEKLVDRALEPLASPGDGRRQADLLAQLDSQAGPLVDEALLASLAANNKRLEELTREIDYSGDRASPLLELAGFEELWAAAYARYGYLSGIIDFSAAHHELGAFLARQDARKRQARYAAYGVGIGIGLAAIVISAGAALEAAPVAAEGAAVATRAATLMGIPLRAWLIGSGLITAGQAAADYVDSRRAAEVARDFYLATVRTGGHEDMQYKMTMARDDYRLMLLSLVMLGAEMKVLTALSTGRTLVGTGGKLMVQLGADEVATLRKVVAALAARAEALAPLGRALVATLRQLLGMTVGIDRVMALEEAIPLVARQMKMTVPAVRARLEANVLVGYLIKGYRARVLARPAFLRTMIEQQLGQGIVGIVTEKLARGDEFNNQLGDVTVDMATGTAWTAALVWIDAPTVALAAEATAASRVRVQAGFGAKAAQFGRDFIDRGKKNFIVGFTTNGAIRAVAEGIGAWKHRRDPNAPDLGDRAIKVGKDALFGGTFLAVSSDLRYQGYKWIEDNLGRVIKEPGEAKIVLDSINLANNYFGGWHYIELGKLAGIQSSGDPAAPASVESLGQAFFRVDADENAAHYAFDFLRQGEGAGPAPVVQ